MTHTKDTDYLQWFTFSSYKGPRCLSIKVLWLFTTFLSRCEIADLEMSSGGSEQEDVRVFIRRETGRLSQDRQTTVIRAHNSSRDRSHLLNELFPAWICHLVGTEVTAATPTVPPLSFQCTLERETTCFCVQTGPRNNEDSLDCKQAKARPGAAICTTNSQVCVFSAGQHIYFPTVAPLLKAILCQRQRVEEGNLMHSYVVNV